MEKFNYRQSSASSIRKWLFVVVVVLCVGAAVTLVKRMSATGPAETISVSGAWALYPMVTKWAEEFQKTHKGVRVDVAAGGAGKGMADALMKVVDIGMVSRNIFPAEIDKGAWFIAVTKDAVVPTINAANPAIQNILASGVKKETLENLWVTGGVKNWDEFVKEGASSPVHIFTRSDSCGAAETWAAFLGKKQEDLLGVGVYGDPGVAEAVRQDVLGIGYNNVNFAYDAKTKRQVEGLKVLPLDLNGNGVIEDGENFYDERDKLVEAIADGKYPSPPARDLYLVSKGVPSRSIVREFLEWILTEGQVFVPETGYVNLSKDQLKKELDKLQ